jgi:hypothetical protein
MDSMMALEVRSRLAAALGVPLPSTVALDHPTVAALAAALATALPGPATGASDRPDGPADAELSGLLDEIDALADADARTRLSS